MDFAILYIDAVIECFCQNSVASAKKYVRDRYLDNGKGCSIIYFNEKGERVIEPVNPPKKKGARNAKRT